MSGQWGPDLRDRPEPARPEVVLRHGDDGRREAAYFATAGPVPVDEKTLARPDVTNPRREEKRRGRAYSDDLEGDL